ncbi:unnamed protein product [Auanema sp. JU1783]|nr:unnamed protein product [Auanema sp. JU1783]
MSHSYRVTPQPVHTTALPCNVYSPHISSPKTSPKDEGSARKRHNSGSVHRHPSILSGLRNLMVRPRSESLNSQTMQKPVRQMMKVQVSACQVESVYDLREGGAEADFYDDETAFRRPRSNSSDFLILRKTSRPLSVDVVGLVDAQSDPYRQYMKVVDCYELAPVAGNIIALDKEMKVEKAFAALCDNNVGAGLVWDASKNKIISIVTLTDFIGLLQSDRPTTSQQSLSAILSGNELVTMSAEKRLLDACEEFCLNHVHRLVITEPGSGDVLYLLTIKRILQAIHKQNRSLHFAQWLSCPINYSAVGTWNQTIHKLTTTENISTAVRLMLDTRVSSFPVVDESGKAIDVLCKADLALALRMTPVEQHSQLIGSPVASILSSRPAKRFMRATDSVGKILDALLCSRHTRSVFVINSDGLPIACVSQSDVISHLIHDETPFQRCPPKVNETAEEALELDSPTQN